MTIVTELGSNIVKYAEKGFIRLNFIGEEQNDTVIVDVWAEDEGPGISNVDMGCRIIIVPVVPWALDCRA